MSTENRWRGDALPIAQQDTITIAGTPSSGGGDTVAVTINTKVVLYTTIVGDTTITIAAALAALLDASTIPEFLDALWNYTAGNATIQVIASTPGVEYIYTVAATGGGTTIATANNVAGTGPSYINNILNWTAGAVPASGQAVVIDGNDGGAPILYGLPSGGYAPDSVTYRATWANATGLPQRNTSNGGYYEYRPRFMYWATAVGNIGTGQGPGSGQAFIKIAASSTWNIFLTGSRDQANVPSVDFIGGNATAVNIIGGDVGLCVTDDSTTPTIGSVSLTGQNAAFWQGTGTTLTACINNGGTVQSYGTCTLLTQYSGIYTQEQGTLTAYTAIGTVAGGQNIINLNQAGTVATAIAESQGPGQNAVQVIADNNSLARTFTNCTFTGGSALFDAWKTVTFTNAGTWDAASVAASDLGPTFSLTRT